MRALRPAKLRRISCRMHIPIPRTKSKSVRIQNERMLRIARMKKKFRWVPNSMSLTSRLKWNFETMRTPPRTRDWMMLLIFLAGDAFTEKKPALNTNDPTPMSMSISP